MENTLGFCLQSGPSDGESGGFRFGLCGYSSASALTLVANGEYDAASDYAPYILEYPQIESVLKDEIRHGDNAKELIAKYF